MANLKYSRQRESIKHFLATTKEHPTADTVYTHVKEEFPNISLGTVYRNLKLLTDLGEAIKITDLTAVTGLMDALSRTIIFIAQSANEFWIWIWI